MARISKYDELKPRAFAEFEKGLSRMDVYRVLKIVPLGTVYGWFELYNRNLERIRKNGGVAAITTADSKTVNSNLLTLLPTQDDIDHPDLGDFELVRRTARNIIRDRRSLAPVRLQAAGLLLKTIEVRKLIKIKDEDDVFVAEDLTVLSDEELQKMSAQPEAESA
jgi:hypothetical protein